MAPELACVDEVEAVRNGRNSVRAGVPGCRPDGPGSETLAASSRLSSPLRLNAQPMAATR